MADDPFPWHLGVFDAHCHPTDTMSSIPSIPSMKARCLTVMATRGQDQELVDQVGEKYGVRSAEVESWDKDECVVPCFGWHPWFAHMMYIDDEASDGEENGKENKEKEKDKTSEDTNSTSNNNTPPTNQTHYTSILRPTPQESHSSLLATLPPPQPFSTFLAQTRSYLSAHPHALVGEIGLDRSFRIPDPSSSPQNSSPDEEGLPTPGGREGRRLTPFRCAPEHQKRIFKKQLQLAAEMGRGVSVHGVQAHGMVFEVLQELWRGHERVVLSKRRAKKKMEEEQQQRRNESNEENDGEEKQGNNNNNEQQQQQQPQKPPYPPRICLHSYSGTPSHLVTTYLSPTIPASLFFSFSHAINLSSVPLPPPSTNFSDTTPQPFIDVVKAVPDHMILVESDLHTAGDDMDRRLEEVVRRVCWVKGWGVEEGVEVLRRNWGRWVFGEVGWGE
ncbi:Metallo-dependent hydrolase [Periconia macrospinosa]|uniref:Metallo-dependent hydrolase n=1 Tax=Periconia macrospinosa TaxID=97972 RepID=A0A2V1DG92_9PLEO|nr:Metallo-dependent hydrolase [Periconia macrospinosa]